MEEVKKVGLIDKVKNYLKETQSEAKKVSWPDRKYVWSATSIIILIVILLSVLLMVVDLGLSKAVTVFTRH